LKQELILINPRTAICIPDMVENIDSTQAYYLGLLSSQKSECKNQDEKRGSEVNLKAI